MWAKFQYTDFEGGHVFSTMAPKGEQDFSAPETENSSTPWYTLIMTAPLLMDCLRAGFVKVKYSHKQLFLEESKNMFHF